MIKKFIIAFTLILSTMLNLTAKNVMVRSAQNHTVKQPKINKKDPIKLTFHIAKIISAVLLAYGNVQIQKFLNESSDLHQQVIEKTGSSNKSESRSNLFSLKTLKIDFEKKELSSKTITPMIYPMMYPLSLAIAAYLVYDGASGIYKTIKNWNRDNGIRVNRKW